MKIKKHIYWQIALFGLIVGPFMSCSDNYFDTEIGGRITPDQHYNSAIDADLSTFGCFVFLQDIAQNMVLVDGLRSDQLNITENANPDMINIYMHDLSADNPYFDPSVFYKMIINVNEVLPNLAPIMEKDLDFDSLYLTYYTGSLITLRSWAYFTLARINGEVGLVDGNLSHIDPSTPPEYISKAEIIDRLIAELLPFVDEEDIVRFPLDHYVLLGELYLEKGDYASAAKYLKFAIDGPAYSRVFLVDIGFSQEAWQNIFLNSSGNETTVFTTAPYSITAGQKNMLEEWMLPSYSFMVKPSSIIINAFKNEVSQAGDPGDFFRGVGSTYDTLPDGSAYVNKYSIDLGLPHSADVILYRAADVHLLLAEALNRMGETDNALLLLNNGIGNASPKPPGYTKWSPNIGVRGRVYLQAKTIPSTVTNLTEYVEDLIIQERAQELAFEGKRWFDLIRIAERRGDPSFLANKVSAKFEDPAVAASIKSKLSDPTNWYLPIPKVGSK
jgi:hypothetical protein